MQIIPTRTLLAGVFVVLLVLLPASSQVARAQAVPCDNSQAQSVIPRYEKGRYLMPEEIRDNSEMKKKLKASLTEEDIRRCLESNKPLRNHVIDFDRYVAAWMKLKDPKPALLIKNSVLWSFKERGMVDLAAFARDTEKANGKDTNVITGKFQWENVTLGPSFSARAIKFSQGTSFAYSRFPNLADFSYSTFGDKVSFDTATFGDEASFNTATFGNYATFPDAHFGNDASFDMATFGDYAIFPRAQFGNDASFVRATFGNYAGFFRAIFLNFNTSCKRSFDHFSDDFTRNFNPLMRGIVLLNNASFDEATFGDDALLAEAKFGNYATFNRTTFGNRTSFFEATFGNYASFDAATFGDDALFVRATFGDNASFFGATLGKDTSLRLARVRGNLDLSSTTWEGRADFRGAVIQGLSWTGKNHPSGIKGVFDAREAKFKNAVIKDVHFSDLVDFSHVEFGGSWKFSSDKKIPKADSCQRPNDVPPAEQSEQKTEEFIFQNLIFEKEVDFLRASFRNNAIFVRNRFLDAWDLTGVKLPKKEGPEDTKNPHLCLSFNRINKLFMEREHLGYESSWTEDFSLNWRPRNALGKSRIRGVIGDDPYTCSDFLDKSREENESGTALDKSYGKNKSDKKNEDLGEIYKTIESSFRGTNDRLAENEAWYLSMVAERESQYSDVEYWTFRIFADLPSRYGIDLYRVVLVSVVLMLVFTIIYWCYFLLLIHFYKWKLNVKLKPFPDQKRAFRFRPFERFFQSREKQERPLHHLKDALFLSGRAFFKLGLGTAYPRTRMLVWITGIEWIVGMYMLIHFLLAVKNTLPIAVPFLAVAG